MSNDTTNTSTMISTLNTRKAHLESTKTSLEEKLEGLLSKKQIDLNKALKREMSYLKNVVKRIKNAKDCSEVEVHEMTVSGLLGFLNEQVEVDKSEVETQIKSISHEIKSIDTVIAGFQG